MILNLLVCESERGKRTAEDINTSFYLIAVGFWKDIKNRKKLFDSIAEEIKMDPLYATNWYALSRKTLRSYTVYFRPMFYLLFIIYFILF
jgi:hypothetical protein